MVPDDLLARLEAAGPDAPSVGRDLAVEMLRDAPGRAAGVYLVAPFKNPAEVLHLLED